MESGAFLAGFPARPHREWIKSEAYVIKLPEMAKRHRYVLLRIVNISTAAPSILSLFVKTWALI